MLLVECLKVFFTLDVIPSVSEESPAFGIEPILGDPSLCSGSDVSPRNNILFSFMVVQVINCFK